MVIAVGRSERLLRTAIWLATAAGVALLLFWRWPDGQWLAVDFQRLLPATQQDHWRTLAVERAGKPFRRQLIMVARGAGAQKFLDSSVAELASAGFADTGFDAEQAQRWRHLADTLQPFSARLATSQDVNALETNAGHYLLEFRKLLYSPLGGSWINALPEDPLGLFQRMLAANLPAATGMAAESGYAITYVSVPEDALGFDRIGGLYDAYRSLGSLAAERGIEFHAMGSPLFNAYGARSGQREVSTIGVLSLLTLVALLWYFLRTGRGLLLTLLVVSSGLAGGLAITLSVFQEIHLLALVFGATLIGIASDYALHYLGHSLSPGWQADTALRRVSRGLTLSLLSSVMAFGVLFMVPFPGLRQIGVFMAGGLICAFATVYLLFPAWYRQPGIGGRIPGPLASGAGPSINVWLLFGILAALAVPLILRMQPVDQVRDFYASPTDLQSDQQTLNALLQTQQNSSFLLLKAPDTETLLQREEQLVAAVPGLQPGITGILPSELRQQRALKVQRELFSAGIIPAHLLALGFDKQYVSQFGDKLASSQAPLHIADLDTVALPLLSGGFLGCANSTTGDDCATWLALDGTIPAATLAAAIAHQPDVVSVEPIEDINRTLGQYRRWTSYFLLASALAVSAALCLALGWRAGVRIMSLPISACVLSFVLTGLVNGSYNIVNILALFLVAGVSLDFAIFREINAGEHPGATRLAILLSALTSILAFGVLSLSQTPLISDFGQSLGLGLLFAWLLSWLTPRVGRAE